MEDDTQMVIPENITVTWAVANFGELNSLDLEINLRQVCRFQDFRIR
jgi:hypothetical protein